MDKSIEKIPTYALCYLVNGDATGLTDEEVAMIDEVVRKYHIIGVYPMTDTKGESLPPYFTSYPFFGLPTEVEDCTVIFND